jgi:soluble lytic murein transglycosylase
MGDYQTAIERFQTTLQTASSANELDQANLGIGQAYYYQENFAAALDYLRPAAESSDPVIAARTQYFLGKAFTQLERYDEAVAAYAAYVSLRPGIIDTHVLTLQGDLHYLVGDYSQAISAYQAAFLTADSGSVGSERLSVKIATAYENLGDVETALSLYQDIYNTSESDYVKAQMDLLIGRILLAREQPDQAYTYFQDAVNQFPYTYDAYSALVTLVNNDVPVNEYKRGLVNYYVGQYALAIEAFDRYLSEAPSEFTDSALYHKALALRASGASSGTPQNEAAIAIWQQLIENYPTSTFYIDAWEDIEFTQWAYMNDPAAAAETSLNFVARNPDAAEAPYFLFLAGRSYERAGLLSEAAEAWERVPDEYPNSEETFRSTFFAGIALYRLNDYASAQQVFDRALVLASQSHETAAAYFWIGKSQERQGEIAASLDSWKLAQTADPFGYYSIRAEDLLIGRDVFSSPVSYDLQPSLSNFRLEAEIWLKSTFNLPADINLESPGLLAADTRFQRGQELWALGEYVMAKTEFEALRVASQGDPAQSFRLIQAFVDIGLYRSALIASTNLLKSAGLEGASALEAPEYFSRIRFGAYYLEWVMPLAEAENFSPLFLLSLIRQESTYEGFIQSRAGARGLMQIIPSTGAQLANELGWPENYSEEDLYRPYVSLRLGTIYLDRQRQYFDGDLYAMLAAYNGGPGNTIAWKALVPNDQDLFLETVRIEETRNYIRLITEIHYIYRWLYGNEGQTYLPIDPAD